MRIAECSVDESLEPIYTAFARYIHQRGLFHFPRFPTNCAAGGDIKALAVRGKAIKTKAFVYLEKVVMGGHLDGMVRGILHSNFGCG